jgi:hypothetical protein
LQRRPGRLQPLEDEHRLARPAGGHALEAVAGGIDHDEVFTGNRKVVGVPQIAADDRDRTGIADAQQCVIERACRLVCRRPALRHQIGRACPFHAIGPGRIAEGIRSMRQLGSKNAHAAIGFAPIEASVGEVGDEKRAGVARQAGERCALVMLDSEPEPRRNPRLGVSARHDGQQCCEDQGSERTHRNPPFAAKRKLAS